MLNKDFAHLHVHSEYSLLDGMGSPEKWCKQAKKMGFTALALTDHGNIDNAIKFQQAADQFGIKPIFGVECYIVPDKYIKKPKEKRGHITLLAKDETGFNNICLLLNTANVDGFYYRPRIDYEDLLNHCEGLIVMTACAMSFLHLEGSEDFFWDLDEKIRGDIYLEVMPHLLEVQYDVNETVLNLHEEYPDIKLVATNDAHCITKEDQKSQEVLLAVNSKASWDDPDRWRFSFDGYYMRSAEEMINAFFEQDQLTEDEIYDAMETTMEIVDKCNFRINQIPISLPKVRDDGAEFLQHICLEELAYLFMEGGIPQEYLDRFWREFDLLVEKNFIDYFLIVYELIEWCLDNDIMIGPGRGCFLPGSKVVTAYHNQIEYKNIEDVCHGDKVISHDRTLNSVINVFEYDVEEDLLEIEVEDGRIISCTPDHKIMTREGWKEAQHLTENDEILDWRR